MKTTRKRYSADFKAKVALAELAATAACSACACATLPRLMLGLASGMEPPTITATALPSLKCRSPTRPARSGIFALSATRTAGLSPFGFAVDARDQAGRAQRLQPGVEPAAEGAEAVVAGIAKGQH